MIHTKKEGYSTNHFSQARQWIREEVHLIKQLTAKYQCKRDWKLILLVKIHKRITNLRVILIQSNQMCVILFISLHKLYLILLMIQALTIRWKNLLNKQIHQIQAVIANKRAKRLYKKMMIILIIISIPPNIIKITTKTTKEYTISTKLIWQRKALYWFLLRID